MISKVNNAGGGDNKGLMDITPEQLQHEFGLNVFGTIYLTQAVVGLGKMPQGGRIINVSSIASKLGLDGVTVYSAAKAAQDSITASLAGEVSNIAHIFFCRRREVGSDRIYSLGKAVGSPLTQLHPARSRQRLRSRFLRSLMGLQARCRPE